MVFVSGMPPFDPETGEIAANARSSQAELILTQMKTAFEAAGSDLNHVLKCNVMCISKDRFKTFNEIYKPLPDQSAGRVFFCVPEWTGPFDIEIDCIAREELRFPWQRQSPRSVRNFAPSTRKDVSCSPIPGTRAAPDAPTPRLRRARVNQHGLCLDNRPPRLRRDARGRPWASGDP